MGTAIKHPVPDRVKPSFVIFDIRATVGFKGLNELIGKSEELTTNEQLCVCYTDCRTGRCNVGCCSSYFHTEHSGHCMHQ